MTSVRYDSWRSPERRPPSESTSSKNRIAGAFGARGLEQLVQLLLRLPEPHVEHLLDADGDEVDARLAGGGARQEGLAAAGRAVEQEPAADLLAERLVQIGPLERIEHAQADLLLELVEPADVGEGDRRLLDLADLRLRLVGGLLVVLARPLGDEADARARIVLGAPILPSSAASASATSRATAAS